MGNRAAVLKRTFCDDGNVLYQCHLIIVAINHMWLLAEYLKCF